MIYVLALWLLVELTAQFARYGVTKAWRLPWTPAKGITLHPLLIFYESASIVPHERVHAEQMAHYTWTGWVLLYLLSGRWRVRLEAEAYALTHAPENANADWVDGIVGKLLGPVYFPRIVRWQRPDPTYARSELWWWLAWKH